MKRIHILLLFIAALIIALLVIYYPNGLFHANDVVLFMAAVGAGLTPALPEGTIEITLATYGDMNQPIYMSRETAIHYAEQMKGQILKYPDGFSIRVDDQYRPKFKIIDTRLEDDNPGDPERGRVVAICQPLPNRTMEVK